MHPRSRLLPLLVAKAGPFKSKFRLQKAAYLVQSMCGKDDYDFKGHPCGIYAEKLDRGMMDNPALNPRQVLPDYDYPGTATIP